MGRVLRFAWLLVVAALFTSPLLAGDLETTIRISLSERSQLEELTRLVSIEDVRGLEVRAVASPKQLAALQKAGYTYEQIDDARAPEQATMCPAGWVDNSDRAYDCYPSYSQYLALMQRFAADHPTLCQLENIGSTTNQSRPHDLWVMRISDNPATEEDEPEVFYTSSMHGNETTGYVLMLRLIDELLSSYGVDPAITELVDETEIWINPLGNPDGAYYGSDSDISSAIRSYTTSTGASAGMDPNRNFPDPEDGSHPDGNPWWTETQHMMAFAEAQSFVLAANFHGGAEVINYPWDTWSRRHPDDLWLIDISRAYAEQAQADANQNGYLTDENDGITNGYDWYTTSGNRQDYMNFFHGCREVTAEISSTKLLPASQLDVHWTYNRQALLDYIAQSKEGIRGLVTDADTGLPVAATIEIVGHDTVEDQSWVYSDPAVGDYHRMLLPGTYTVRFSGTGYAPQTSAGIVVDDGPATILNAQLVALATAAVSGEVTTPGGRAPIVGASVEIVGTASSTQTGADGLYTFAAVYTGDYTFRITAAGFESIEVARTIGAPASTLNFALAPLNEDFFTDLEPDDGGLSGSGDWQWGEPSGAGHPGAHSGSRVWATILGGEYLDDGNSLLDLLDISVSAGVSELHFWHYYDIEDGANDYDGGNLSVRAAGGGTYQLLTPASGYPSNDVSSLGEPGFTGTLSAWEEVVFDLSGWVGQSIDLRWRFATDGSVHQLGWYVDDLSLRGATAHAADFDVTPVPATPNQPVLFTDRTTGAVSAWSWSFGDGGSADVQNPAHTFTHEGVFVVTLQATLPEGVLTRVKTVLVGTAEIFQDGFETGSTGEWSVVAP